MEHSPAHKVGQTLKETIGDSIHHRMEESIPEDKGTKKEIVWKNPKAKNYPLMSSSRKLSGSPFQHCPEFFFATGGMFSSISSEDLELQYPGSTAPT